MTVAEPLGLPYPLPYPRVSSTLADLRAAALLALLGLLLAGSAGCSLVFVDGPPPNHLALPYFDCTSSNLAPVGDMIVAGTEALVGLSAIHDVNNSGSTSQGRDDLLGAALVAASFVTSGVIGFRRVSACRDAKAQLIARSMENETSRLRQALAPPVPLQGGSDPWLAPGPPAAAGWRAPPLPPPPPSAAAPPPTPATPAPPPAQENDSEDPSGSPRSAP